MLVARHVLACVLSPKTIHGLNRWNIYAKIACMFLQTSISSDSRQEFRHLLHQQKELTDRLLEQLEDPSVSSIGLMETIEMSVRLDRRKAELALVFREEVSSQRTREEERSVRQFVLRALNYVACPQPARFLREFMWAHERVDLETRGFGALRRDEARAWHRRPGHRIAYVVPALDPAGHALAKWMARSDWPLASRIVVDGADRLFSLRGLSSVFRARSEASGSDVGDPYLPLIERYAMELEVELTQPLPEKDWLASVRANIEEEVQTVGLLVSSAQIERERELTLLPEEQQLWGSL